MWIRMEFLRNPCRAKTRLAVILSMLRSEEAQTGKALHVNGLLQPKASNTQLNLSHLVARRVLWPWYVTNEDNNYRIPYYGYHP